MELSQFIFHGVIRCCLQHGIKALEQCSMDCVQSKLQILIEGKLDIQVFPIEMFGLFKGTDSIDQLFSFLL